mmetsp:Transcript_11657/g.14060  ORF Transcript_11657/g.14060 Transcript_11657/m.14060 type:complete len:402 (+) Transcript_11657:153-1358(+)|eukprot:CAMPEP_0114360710 /NCGR_PEP_ID=MMETSP0101-20121206/24067_1 /TAXON_ID=38822 ORGANISM="Pteridomonas danica, Strain PT" /NCGR_SAMPLE_ID=MMETSP0101 /ASSEMBLY_ACC=CAM_ASM_000211 /LENGTH=401 /DNA_ID=CAMNT_0001505081 /DNA_START=108 /DNA_END=1313 /DNA_ORIENTATION=-
MATFHSPLPSPLLEYLQQQQSNNSAQKSNEESNQDSFKGVEEFDMHTSTSNIFSDFFETKSNFEDSERKPDDDEQAEEETIDNLIEEEEIDILSQHKNKEFMSSSELIDRSPAINFRKECRNQHHQGQTSGVASGFVQANMVALPKEYARDFLEFIHANPKGCPLLAVTTPGDSSVPTCAENADLKTDIPKYRIWTNGKLKEEVSDATSYWNLHKDMVGFLLGCSFSWEGVLIDSGYTPRHLEKTINKDGKEETPSKNVPMYRTNLSNVKKGCFGGEVVVSMRPYKAHELQEVFNITARYPDAHGAPIHWGDPHLIGIGKKSPCDTKEDSITELERWSRALSHPDFGDHVQLREGDIPVFWACGVTSQMALVDAKLPLVITHAPGHMFICDISEEELVKDI